MDVKGCWGLVIIVRMLELFEVAMVVMRSTQETALFYAQIEGTTQKSPQRLNPIGKSKEPLYKFKLELSICLMHWHNKSFNLSWGGVFIIEVVGVRDF